MLMTGRPESDLGPDGLHAQPRSTAQARLMLIGCGPHARRIYLPALQRLASGLDVRLPLVVDIEAAGVQVREALRDVALRPELLLVAPFSGTLPPALERELDRQLARHHIEGVIIATEPTVHKAYADWAIRRHLHILMDKPITARADAATDPVRATAILDDYLDLQSLHEAAQARKQTVFMVNCQRRFHDGFLFVESLIKDVADKTGCPVTSLQSSHCDGQWRFPAEIVTQDYHPYNQGYGKASHSGYHLFDIAYRLYNAPGLKEKQADAMEIVSSMVRPNGFLQQLTEHDYERLFGGPYRQVKRWSDTDLKPVYEGYGELDVSALISMKKGAETVANLNINLMHNGFSRRTWLRPGADLYKGNGRVRHEHHNVQQGPFQNIQIHSYQSNDDHDSANGWTDDPGGNNHFDVYVFTNPLISGRKESMQVHKLADLITASSPPASGTLEMEAMKLKVVRSFVEHVAGLLPKAAMPSQIDDHIVPVQLMSGIYLSQVRRSQGGDPIVRSPFGFDTTGARRIADAA